MSLLLRRLTTATATYAIPAAQATGRAEPGTLKVKFLVPVATATATAAVPTLKVKFGMPRADASASFAVPTLKVKFAAPVASASASAALPTLKVKFGVPTAGASASFAVPTLKVKFAVPAAPASGIYAVPTLRAVFKPPVAAAIASSPTPKLVVKFVVPAMVDTPVYFATPKLAVKFGIPAMRADATFAVPSWSQTPSSAIYYAVPPMRAEAPSGWFFERFTDLDDWLTSVGTTLVAGGVVPGGGIAPRTDLFLAPFSFEIDSYAPSASFIIQHDLGGIGVALDLSPGSGEAHGGPPGTVRLRALAFSANFESYPVWDDLTAPHFFRLRVLPNSTVWVWEYSFDGAVWTQFGSDDSAGTFAFDAPDVFEVGGSNVVVREISYGVHEPVTLGVKFDVPPMTASATFAPPTWTIDRPIAPRVGGNLEGFVLPLQRRTRTYALDAARARAEFATPTLVVDISAREEEEAVAALIAALAGTS